MEYSYTSPSADFTMLDEDPATGSMSYGGYLGSCISAPPPLHISPGKPRENAVLRFDSPEAHSDPMLPCTPSYRLSPSHASPQQVVRMEREVNYLRTYAESAGLEVKQLKATCLDWQRRLWADRQYFAQYSKLFFVSQEAGMRREAECEEAQSWAELLLAHAVWMGRHSSSLSQSKCRDSTSPSLPSEGLSLSHSASQTCSLSQPQREESLTTSPRRSHSSSPEPRRKPGNDICTGQSETSLSDLHTIIASQQKQIEALETASRTTEVKALHLAEDLQCERTLTLEMQEEIDDLMLSEVVLQEEAWRSSLESQWSDGLLASLSLPSPMRLVEAALQRVSHTLTEDLKKSTQAVVSAVQSSGEGLSTQIRTLSIPAPSVVKGHTEPKDLELRRMTTLLESVSSSLSVLSSQVYQSLETVPSALHSQEELLQESFANIMKELEAVRQAQLSAVGTLTPTHSSSTQVASPSSPHYSASQRTASHKWDTSSSSSSEASTPPKLRRLKSPFLK